MTFPLTLASSQGPRPGAGEMDTRMTVRIQVHVLSGGTPCPDDTIHELGSAALVRHMFLVLPKTRTVVTKH
jgi:hypothetical protein